MALHYPATATLAVGRIDCKRLPPAVEPGDMEHSKRQPWYTASVQPEHDW
jgi:hypothetical protein